MPDRIWNAAEYTRLSRDDGDKAESNSITSQKEIIRDYVRQHPEFVIVKEYADDGYSGVNFERPGFKQMMEDIKAKKIDCVICKDLSRFARNYIDAGRYLEKIFPFMGVRFIAINDSYDSCGEKAQSDALIVPFKNLINDAYCRDISVKIRSQLDIKRKMGDFIGAFAPYGYRKDEANRNRLVVDEEAARTVELIFSLRIQGLCNSAIADRLNSMGILSPMEYKQAQGLNYSCGFRSNEQAQWSPMGDLVFGRMPTALYLGKPDYHYEPDESKWRILPDMHEALVSRSDFYQVREVLEAGRRENNAKLEASREYREKHPQIFKSGIVRCGHCGSNLGYSRHGEKKEGRYSCRNKQYGRCDVAVGISEKKLAPIVWNAIQIQFALFADFEEVAGRLKDSGIQTKRQTELQQEMLEVSEQLSGYQNKREQLYNDYVDGILSAGDYIKLKTRFDTAYQEQSSRLNQLSVELARLNRMLSDENKWLVNIRNIRKARKLTPEIAQAMIDHINVYKTGYAQHRLEIIFRFQEERDVLEAVYHEMEGGEPQ